MQARCMYRAPPTARAGLVRMDRRCRLQELPDAVHEAAGFHKRGGLPADLGHPPVEMATPVSRHSSSVAR